MNITDALLTHSQENPSLAAVELGDLSISFAELYGLVENCKHSLAAAGIRQGDTVVLVLPSNPKHLILLLGLAASGASIVALPVASTTPDSFTSATRGLKIDHVVVQASASSLGSPNHLVFEQLVPDLTATTPPDTALPNSEDPGLKLLLGQSAGTTGEPKRFFVTQEQAFLRARESIAVFDYQPGMRCLVGIGMSFFTGVMHGILRAHVGCTQVFPLYQTAPEYIETLKQERIDFSFVLPSRLESLLSLHTPGNPPMLEGVTLLCSSTYLPPRLKQAAREKICEQVVETYATNEAGTIAIDRHDPDNPYPEATGILFEGIEAEIVGTDHEPLPPGSPGQVRIRKPLPWLPTEYVDNPQATQRAFKDGWFYPGDIGSINDEGYLFLKGRADDVINQGGLKIYPAEIEPVLLAHPAVVEAAVTAVPHRSYGQIPVAFIRTEGEASKRELISYCEQRLANRAPKDIVWVSEMPLNERGKVLKRVLRESYLKRK